MSNPYGNPFASRSRPGVAYERASTQERGYGSMHQAERARWAPKVAAGMAWCARCKKAIHPDEPWDLDHDDSDRTRYLGPSHARCNRVAGNQSKKRRSRGWSRQW